MKETTQICHDLRRKDLDSRTVMVCINCITYNHEPYIRDALEGFVMQNTDFPFVAIVHDDASTDGTADIIREYAAKYPDIIKPIYENENQYSKRDGTLDRIMNMACLDSNAKYIAYCEGDDYWTDPLKLQKQVNFLETHPDYSMCFHACYNRNETTGKVRLYKPFRNDFDVSFNQIVMEGGLFCPTPSLICRKEVFNRMPEVFRSQHVGDYPLQIYLASEGKVRYMAEPMCTYRVSSINSWTARMSKTPVDHIIVLEEKLLHEIDAHFKGVHHDIFLKREMLYKYNMYNGSGKYDCAIEVVDAMMRAGMKVPYIQLLKLKIKKLIHWKQN